LDTYELENCLRVGRKILWKRAEYCHGSYISFIKHFVTGKRSSENTELLLYHRTVERFRERKSYSRSRMTGLDS
jgi:hypothetical protein